MPVEARDQSIPRTHAQIGRINTGQADQCNKEDGIDRETASQERCQLSPQSAIQPVQMTNRGKEVDQPAQPECHAHQVKPVAEHR